MLLSSEPSGEWKPIQSSKVGKSGFPCCMKKYVSNNMSPFKFILCSWWLYEHLQLQVQVDNFLVAAQDKALSLCSALHSLSESGKQTEWWLEGIDRLKRSCFDVAALQRVSRLQGERPSTVPRLMFQSDRKSPLCSSYATVCCAFFTPAKFLQIFPIFTVCVLNLQQLERNAREGCQTACLLSFVTVEQIPRVACESDSPNGNRLINNPFTCCSAEV